MANFNGAFLQAFTGIAPDHTATQLNRLSDMAFTSNTLVGKLQTKKFAIFIPESFVMPKGDQKTYWSDPRKELDTLPFDQLNVCVDGILLIQAATTPDPTFSPAAGSVVPGTSITISDSDTGATIYYTKDGTVPNTNSPKYSAAIPIGAASTPSVTIQAFAVSPNKSPSNTVVGVFSPTAAAPAPAVVTPALSAAALDDPGKAANGAQVVVDLTGKGLVTGDTQLIFNNDAVHPYDVTASADGTTGTATVTLPSPYGAGTNYPCLLKSKKSGTSSAAVNLKTSH